MKLTCEIDREETRAHVDLLVSSQAALFQNVSRQRIDIPFGSRHDARMNELFLRLSGDSYVRH